MSSQTLVTLVFGLAVGLGLGTAIGALLAKSRAAFENGELAAALQLERAAAAERLALLTGDQSRNRAVESMISPVTETLATLASKVDLAERLRIASQTEVSAQLKSMVESSLSLHDQTGRLVRALSRSEFRGRWGEAQLRRTVEVAGLMAHVHFVEQPSVQTRLDGVLRPDMLITMSNQRLIVIDAKVSLDALLAPDEGGAVVNLGPTPEINPDTAKRHAAAIATHIDQLAAKEYWRQFSRTPEFVVMFLPAESLLGTALQADPALLERAFSRNVVLATPSTLLALLRTVAMGWRDAALTENARAIHELGSELHTRIQLLNSHLAKVGSSLDGAVASYNKAVGSLESRVLVTARKMADLGVSSDVIATIEPIDRIVRPITGVAVAATGRD